MCVYELNGLRVVDLSKPIDPATETRRCHLFRFNTGGAIPDFHTNIDIMSHLGTHAECPYHHDEDWPDVSALPLTTFVGRAVYVKFTGIEGRSHISGQMLDAFWKKIRRDDIVLIDSDHPLEPFTKKTNGPEDERLLVNGETARWFEAHQVKCVGFGDGVSIENSNEDVKPFHDILLAKNIIFLEVLKNLDKLRSDVFFMSYAPMPIKGLDSCPVRAYAIEGIKEFS